MVSERPRPYHPVLLAAFPILYLFAANVREQVSVALVVPPLAVAVGAVVVAMAVGTVATGRPLSSGVAVSAWALLFLSYGHTRNALFGRTLAGVPIGRDAVLLAVWAVLGILAVAVAFRFRDRLAGPTRVLNLLSLGLVVLNATLIGFGFLAGPPATARPGTVVLRARERMPDVYYVIMDRYGSTETLRRRFGFDNTPFLRYLRDRGFYVASRSAANYPKTAHSLAASLNLGYLGELSRKVGSGSDDWSPVYARLRDFEVARALRSIGYRYVHVGSLWEPTRTDPTADVTFTYGSSEFSQVLLDTTVLSGIGRVLGSEGLDPRLALRDWALTQFAKIQEAAGFRGPTFVFAHVLLPHEPYVFDADGSYVTEEEEAGRSLRRNFVGQLRFANSMLRRTIERLLEGPEDPIIVLQADEGPHPVRYAADQTEFRWSRATDAELREKLTILNAYHLPGGAEDAPYPTITPVNTFRLIFDRYFGVTLPLLPDRSYVFLDQRHLYDFVEVTDRLGIGDGVRA